MSKRAVSDPIDDNKNPLTEEQAAELADRLAGAECETAAQMLLLCFALANEPDAGKRDEMFAAIAGRAAQRAGRRVREAKSKAEVEVAGGFETDKGRASAGARPLSLYACRAPEFFTPVRIWARCWQLQQMKAAGVLPGTNTL